MVVAAIVGIGSFSRFRFSLGGHAYMPAGGFSRFIIKSQSDSISGVSIHAPPSRGLRFQD